MEKRRVGRELRQVRGACDIDYGTGRTPMSQGNYGRITHSSWKAAELWPPFHDCDFQIESIECCRRFTS